MATWHQIEKLADALEAFQYSLLPGAIQNPARMESRLFDQCLACGMDYHEPSVSEWATRVIAKFNLTEGDPELVSVGCVAL